MSNATTPRRPARAVVGGAIAVVLSASVVAFAAHQWFYVIVLYGFLLGSCGGLMAWMVLDEFDPGLQGTRIFDVAGLGVRPGWWDHLVATARQGAAFGRLGRDSTIDVGAWFVWGARAIELAIAMCCGAGIARALDHRR